MKAKVQQKLELQNGMIASDDADFAHFLQQLKQSSNGNLGMLDYIEYQKFPIEWKNVNDTSWLVNYTGDWSVVRYLADDAATVTESNVAGNTASFTFDGFAVGVFMQKGSFDGIVDIYLDGTKVATVDTYNATRLEHQLVYQNNSIGSGSHTVEVHVTGTKNASSSGYLGILDSFEYK
ncbi:MAG: hypothetical protein K0R75_3395 [Paenibacillaceae bacterium]|nr:hypothetical protein [Paenibacillaceae bacterium]